MALDASTFDYLAPSQSQVDVMTELRQKTGQYGRELERLLPEGADKTHVLRLLRTLAMWANVAITRRDNGQPRLDG
jgi:hypothetical protein